MSLCNIYCNMQMRFKQKLKKGLLFAFFSFCIKLAKLLGYPCHLGEYKYQDNVRATSGEKMGSVPPVVWELCPIQVEKKVVFRSFSILHKIGQTFGIFLPFERYPMSGEM